MGYFLHPELLSLSFRFFWSCTVYLDRGAQQIFSSSFFSYLCFSPTKSKGIPNLLDWTHYQLSIAQRGMQWLPIIPKHASWNLIFFYPDFIRIHHHNFFFYIAIASVGSSPLHASIFYMECWPASWSDLPPRKNWLLSSTMDVVTTDDIRSTHAYFWCSADEDSITDSWLPRPTASPSTGPRLLSVFSETATTN